MKNILLTLVMTLASYYSFAQNISYDGETFTYEGNTVNHYGLGWYSDPSASAYGPMAYLSAYGGIKFFTAGTFRGVWDVNGNVGIGTTTPNAPLHIAKVSSPNTSIPMQQWDPLVVGSGYNLTLSNYNSTAGIDYRFTQFQQGIGYPVLTFQAANVGIGTNNPDQKLTVNGTIHSKEVKVDMNILPDYVFKPTYNLTSLKEIRSYIDQNHHLPDVPSAQQVAKNGLNLGEMNAILLKKVEELTLYLIEKDKQVEAQQKVNESLQEQINKLAEKQKN